MEQAIRGVQRHRQQAAVVPACAPASTPACCARLFRHSGAGAAVLPLPHERLREQHPGHCIDGQFGASTEAAVRAYQRFCEADCRLASWDVPHGTACTTRRPLCGHAGPVVTLKTPALTPAPRSQWGLPAVQCSTTTACFCSALPTTLPAWRTRPSPTSTPTRLPPPPAAHRSCWACPRPALRMPTHGQLWKR